MLVTPYLISMVTPGSPRLLVEGSTTSSFQVYLREFNYLFRARRAGLAAGRRFGRSDPRARKAPSAVGACVAKIPPIPSINRLLS
jgi:hypothetical protein